MSGKTAGIIGGMGPEATVDLMRRIIRLTPSPELRPMDDQDHIRCIVDNNPKIPSRIDALIHETGEDPAPHIVRMARNLESWGADFLAMPCNTAHYYYDVIQDSVGIPLINMIDLVCRHLTSNFGSRTKTGLLASTAVLKTEVYRSRLNASGFEEIWPDPPFQEKLLQLIRHIKKGAEPDNILPEYEKICENLARKGVDTAVIACTELGMLRKPGLLETVDAAELLAQEVVRLAV